jgi:hypothetical protein
VEDDDNKLYLDTKWFELRASITLYHFSWW